MKINNRAIGTGNEVYIIAEMSANHGGNLATARKIIHAAKEAGADAIKLQTYTADTITLDCDNEHFQIEQGTVCLLYTSPSPRDLSTSRMPSSA